MCTECGCSIETEIASHSDEHLHNNPQLNDNKTISVIQKILEKNDYEAEHNRGHLDKKDVLGINLPSLTPNPNKKNPNPEISGFSTEKIQNPNKM